jgi:hypothetical protein
VVYEKRAAQACHIRGGDVEDGKTTDMIDHSLLGGERRDESGDGDRRRRKKRADAEMGALSNGLSIFVERGRHKGCSRELKEKKKDDF